MANMLDLHSILVLLKARENFILIFFMALFTFYSSSIKGETWLTAEKAKE